MKKKTLVYLDLMVIYFTGSDGNLLKNEFKNFLKIRKF